MIRLTTVLICFAIVLSACQDEGPDAVQKQPATMQNSAALNPEPPALSNSTTLPDEVEREPPRPPLKEDFQGAPKMSLFPRVVDYQPEKGDEAFGYWKTFIDHLIKITRVVENKSDGNRAWSFRSIDTIESLGYFAPVAVTPETDYSVSFDLKADLPEGASAGIGILEFDEFLWIGEQYTEDVYVKHFRNIHDGQRLTGLVDGTYSFDFRTGGETRMIHIVLFRDGTHERKSLLFDNIEIKELLETNN
jgi:hypothetical protein